MPPSRALRHSVPAVPSRSPAGPHPSPHPSSLRRLPSSLVLCCPLACRRPTHLPIPLHCAAFPRPSFLPPQSRRHRAPPPPLRSPAHSLRRPAPPAPSPPPPPPAPPPPPH